MKKNSKDSLRDYTGAVLALVVIAISMLLMFALDMWIADAI